MQFSIYRFDPESGIKPRMQKYTLLLDDCEGSMLLDALIALKSQDETLSFRRSCGEGVCGSDGMNINGKNGLACITPLSALAENKVTVLRPFPGMPVIKDLIVDLTNFYEQYKESPKLLIIKINFIINKTKYTIGKRNKFSINPI